MTETAATGDPAALPLDLLACPRCDRELMARSDTLHCKGCNVNFPLIGGIPWLFSEPQSSMADWRGRYQFAIEIARRDSERAQAAASAAPRTATRARLAQLAKGKAAYATELEQLLAPLGESTGESRLESHLALKTRLPPSQGIDSYHANVHRDWCWGDDENRLSLDLVNAAIAEPPTRVLVLGCGAGRLAYDLHNAYPQQLTVALDINPLLILIAAQIASGQRIDLHEFPLAPRSANDIARARTLQARGTSRPGLHWLLGDAMRPPFPPGAFDLVVTPWFVDVIDQDLETTASRINRVLALGGRWISFGSLAFSGADVEKNYSLEETLDVVADSGFESPDVNEAIIPYLCSPASRHGRRERVMTLSAVKRESIAVPTRHSALPDWIVRSNKPVPLLESFQAQAVSTRIHAFIMSMIDGQRSIGAMAKMMEEQRLMPKTEADQAIRGFLIKMYDESRAGTRY